MIYEDILMLLVVRMVKWRRTGHPPRKKVGASKEHSMKIRREKNIDMATRNKDVEDVNLTELPQHRIC